MNTRLMTQAEPLPGYRLIERLGRGGFGEVWKAEAPGGLFKAIKFVYGDLEGVGEDNKGAEQELKSLNRVKSIRHPYILSIERFDIVAGQLMIVMELADRNLWDRFEECRSQGLCGIPRDELLRYLDESSEALDLMNFQYQIQHLDIKPQNLFLVHNHVKVADFGMAKDFEGIRATVTGGVTPVYAAPETFDGWISRFCDQYSLAIVYQELLTGVRPFPGTNARQLLMQHISAAPDVWALPSSQRDIVARALSKKPNERFASCADFVKAIRESASTQAASPPIPPTASAETWSISKLNKAGDAASADSPTIPANRVPSARALTPGMPPPRLAPRAIPAANNATPTFSNSGSITLQRPGHETGKVSRPGNAPSGQVESPVLFPVYVVAAGNLGLTVLRQLRSCLSDRFGRDGFPHWKWLFVDTDAETIDGATSDPQRRFLDENEVYHARMHRPPHYLKREGLPPPNSWMSNDLLYRIPREPATGGIRCLGRLALLDHYLAISKKVRKDLETFLSDDALAEADRQTGLGIRAKFPRVYLAASLMGGTGSGMFIDLAYVIRHEMRQLGLLNPQITGLLLAPPVDRPMPRTLAAANACAALGELHHWSLASNPFEAIFDMRQPLVADAERPFDRCIALNLPTPAVHDAVQHAADQAARLIYHEALTPLGRGMDRARDEYRANHPSDGISLQTCGFFRFTWPRRHLLDAISHRCAAATVERWCSRDAAPIRQNIAQWFGDEWRQRQLDPPPLTAMLAQSAATALGEKPETLIDTELQSLSTQGPGRSDPFLIARVVDRIMQLVGKAGLEEEETPGRISGILEMALAPIAKDADGKFTAMVEHFVEQPCCDFVAAEEVARLFADRLQRHIDELDAKCDRLKLELEQEFLKILPALGTMSQTGFRMMGASRKVQAMADLLALLREWPRKRLDYLLSRGLVAIYRQMLGNSSDHLRRVIYCRKQMLEIADRIHKASEARADSGSSNDHQILPPGCKTVTEAAERFFGDLSEGDRLDFETMLQRQIREQFRSVVEACMSIAEHGSRLIEMILDQARSFADARLGHRTAAEEFLRNRRTAQEVHRDLLQAFDEITPACFGPQPPTGSQTFLLGVSSDAPGKQLKEIAKELMPEQSIIDSASTEDIVFFREYHDLAIFENPRVGALAIEAISEVKAKQRINPFSRKDVPWTSFVNE